MLLSLFFSGYPHIGETILASFIGNIIYFSHEYFGSPIFIRKVNKTWK
jgi:hypothetical protein